MILNCARGEDLSVEALMRRSFAEFHAARAAPAAAKRALEAKKRVKEIDSLPWPLEWPRRETVELYARLTDEADREAEPSEAGGGSGVAEAPGVLQVLTPGRLVLTRTSPSSPATLGVVVVVVGVGGGGVVFSSSPSGSRNSRSKEVVVLALVEGEEWPLAEEEEGEEGYESESGGNKKASAASSSSSSLLPPPSSLVPLSSKRREEPNPFAGMRVLSGKKSGDLNSQFAALAAPSSSTSSSPSSSSSFSRGSPKLPQRAEAAGVPFALVAVAPRLIDAVFAEKLPHFDGEGVIVAAAAAAAAASSSSSSSATLSSSPTAGAAALALSRARDGGGETSSLRPLDPVSDLRVTGIEASAAARRRAEAVAARSELFAPNSSSSPLPLPSATLAAALSRVRARRAASTKAKKEALAAGGAALEALPEYGARVEALARLGYLEVGAAPGRGLKASSSRGGRRHDGGDGDGDGNGNGNGNASSSPPSPSGNGVALKGRVACELAAAHDGLSLSEALFAGAFASLTSPADAAALLSCYVFQERSKDEDGDPFAARMPTPALELAFETAVEAAAVVGRAHEEAGLIGREAAGFSSSEMLPATVGEWVQAALRPGLVHAVHAWASGAKFVDVCALTEAMEGTIVRTVMRVDEVRGREEEEGEEEEKQEGDI